MITQITIILIASALYAWVFGTYSYSRDEEKWKQESARNQLAREAKKLAQLAGKPAANARINRIVANASKAAKRERQHWHPLEFILRAAIVVPMYTEFSVWAAVLSAVVIGIVFDATRNRKAGHGWSFISGASGAWIDTHIMKNTKRAGMVKLALLAAALTAYIYFNQ